MDSIKYYIEKASLESKKSIAAAITEKDLEGVRVQLLGKKGTITLLNHMLENLSLDEKKIFGPNIQELRKTTEDTINQKRRTIIEASKAEFRKQYHHFDVTLIKYNPNQGSLHPLSLVTYELEEIFISMGFEVVYGQELEDEWHNFTALNIGSEHPARDAHDTFWVNEIAHSLLRTHTSPVQIRTMKDRIPPFAIFSPGRVFRNEATDASHDFQFMQGEALLIDNNVSLAHLLDCAKEFLQTFFNNKSLKIRVRPSYFPFVEPGIEIDIQCPFCKDGCSSCKKTTWIELLGAGLIHPHVLKSGGIDPEKFTGFAMGFGISRLAMLKYGINDVRLLNSNKKEILSQFAVLE